VLRRDERSGTLSLASLHPIGARYSSVSIAASPDGRNVYTVTEDDSSPAAEGLATWATPPLCSPAPLPGCVPGTAATVRVSDKAPATDDLRWTWSGPGPVDVGEPRLTTDLAFCVYDGSARPQPVLSAFVPDGQTCGESACWRATASGFRYKLPTGMPDGVVDVKVVLGGSLGKLQVKGRGPLPPLGLPWATPVRVQLQASHGNCWEATFAAPIRTTDVGFQANR
jgi:hypothetical protein